MPVFFRLNTIKAAILSVKRQQRRHFASLTPLTPLFFRINAVNSAILPIKRRQRYYVSG